ncbi:MAG TPA: VOC family protein [Cytophagales bacterium]|nr:VOC family protein [Cytophagales bacterium]HAP63003.1 VOC family protein [Cytophagales bacterium]
MKKAIVHFEIGCGNLSETVDFYRNVFHWQVTPNEGSNSAAIDMGKEAGLPGHFNQLAPDEPQQYVTLYIETDTLEEDLQAIEANSGKTTVGPVTLPDGRRFAWFEDVAGNKMGLITSQLPK